MSDAVNGQARLKVAVNCSCFVQYAKKTNVGQRCSFQYYGLSKGLVNQKDAKAPKPGALNPEDDADLRRS
jgi:hypothetical protein